MFKEITDFLQKYVQLADKQFSLSSERGTVEAMTELTESFRLFASNKDTMTCTIPDL